MRFSIVAVVASALAATAAPIGTSIPETKTALVDSRDEAGSNAAASLQHHNRHWIGDDGRSCSGYYKRKKGYMHINRNSWAMSPDKLADRVDHCVAGMLQDGTFGDVAEGTVAHYYPGEDLGKLKTYFEEQRGAENGE